jgi:lipopolysaccharide transport system ATP-binding protein
MAIDLEFHGVSKRYRVPAKEGGTRDFLALDNVSFTVGRGEAYGIIGHNGAGKSTALKLIAGIAKPTTGYIETRGRLATLIEVGSGFHPELTGTQNVFLSGTLLGMKRAEVAAKLPSIIEFAETGDFMNLPVKQFSSGMYVRLGFAIAAHLDAEILLLDEVLAVGDMKFQARCVDRIQELRKSGRTIIFISHDLPAVQRLCEKVLWLDHGKVKTIGPAAEVIGAYRSEGVKLPAAERSHVDTSSLDATIESLRFLNATGESTTSFRSGSEFVGRLRYCSKVNKPANAALGFRRPDDGVLECVVHTRDHGGPFVLEVEGEVEFRVANLPLRPGMFYIDVALAWADGMGDFDWRTRCAMVDVQPGPWHQGEYYTAFDWRHKRLQEFETEVSDG